MTTSPTAPIVVGVDGSAQSLRALDWATGAAVARGCPLRVVHAFLWPLQAEYAAVDEVGDDRDRGGLDAVVER